VINKNIQPAHARADQEERPDGLPAGGVLTKTMPLNNATQMTDAERALLRKWYEAGAEIQ
jgi:uncharacterized membrane protein